ncbi:MAG: hypothetical protein KDC95_09850 [Planctomycetes bacterium]|nr:hypothetical protein [Planctomycetota bacterium]
MRSFLLASALLFALPSVLLAQGPGAGRQITYQIGGGIADVKYEGLTSSSADGDTGTRWRRSIGGTWHQDGTWKKSGNNIDEYDDIGPTHHYTVTGAADFTRTQGDIIDVSSGSDVGDWS